MMSFSKLKQLVNQAGDVPGESGYVGQDYNHDVSVEMITYNQTELSTQELSSDKIASADKNEVTWINIDGLHDQKVINDTAEFLKLHRLEVEDVINTAQRPKLIIEDEYLFLTIKMVKATTIHSQIDYEQVTLVLTSDGVVSFQEKPGDVFDAIRHRLKESKGKIRYNRADYLFYALIDVVIDEYFAVLDLLTDRTTEIENRVFLDNKGSLLKRIQKIKNEVARLLKTVISIRDSVLKLSKAETNLISDNTLKYIGDVYDHSMHIFDNLDILNGRINSCLDIHMNLANTKMNSVMKTLTVVASIFIPLTFIAGIYGMNFKNMPELEMEYGYYYAIGAMVIILVGMLIYFRVKKWL